MKLNVDKEADARTCPRRLSSSPKRCRQVWSSTTTRRTQVVGVEMLDLSKRSSRLNLSALDSKPSEFPRALGVTIDSLVIGE